MLKSLGKIPVGKDLLRMMRSPNYKNGSFQNLTPTELIVPGVSRFKMLRDFFNKPAASKPAALLPSIKSDLKTPAYNSPLFNWFGHSSYLVRYKSLNILIDPVLSGYASPFPGIGKSFPGSDIFTPDDFPAIDAMIITHDHYDHLDYQTIRKFAGQTRHYYVALGVGSHLKYWGVEESKITEFDWWDSIEKPGFKLTASPARHFSGRSFQRNKTLWSSFILQLDSYSIFIGSDSGYDSHFTEIGARFGPFDIAFLECGQYNVQWPDIHTMPEEAVIAAKDLSARVLMPVHWGKFALAYHPWNEPVRRISNAAKRSGMTLCTPLIGETFTLSQQVNTEWWEKIG